MRVRVKLFASLQRGREVDSVHDLAEGMTVRGCVRALGLPEGEVTLLFVNGRHATWETPLAEGDTLVLFPPVGGG
jgi:molybdopterin converting factor small subunit